eukprot:COSAG02_NODE_14503_length_1266_cov_1.042024_1_plen_107_part_00
MATANANPVASDIVIPEYDAETPPARAGSDRRDVSARTGHPVGVLRQHRRAVNLQLCCAALVPFNILRHVRVLPSDAISYEEKVGREADLMNQFKTIIKSKGLGDA